MQEITTQTINTGLKATLTHWGFNDTIACYCADFSSLIIILVSSIVVYFIAKIIINKILKRIVEKSASK